jgi:hypothetical protein
MNLSQDLYQFTNRKNYNNALSSKNLSQDLFGDPNRKNYNNGLSSINLSQDLFADTNRENYNDVLSSINLPQDLFRDTNTNRRPFIIKVHRLHSDGMAEVSGCILQKKRKINRVTFLPNFFFFSTFQNGFLICVLYPLPKMEPLNLVPYCNHDKILHRKEQKSSSIKKGF